MAGTTENPAADIRDHIKWSYMVGNFNGLAGKTRQLCGCDCDICNVIFDRMTMLLEGNNG